MDPKVSAYHVNLAAMMFDKRQIKQTRALDNAFAQEHDGVLECYVCMYVCTYLFHAHLALMRSSLAMDFIS